MHVTYGYKHKNIPGVEMPCGLCVCVVVCWEIYPGVPFLYPQLSRIAKKKSIWLIFLSVGAIVMCASERCLARRLKPFPAHSDILFFAACSSLTVLEMPLQPST